MLFYSLDIIGTLVFAISGGLSAVNKRLDIFGVGIIAFVTALGGGTLRDVLLGNTPVGWMNNLDYVYVVIIGTLISIFFHKRLDYLKNSLLLFDTIGIGVFTIIGVEKGIQMNLHPIISVGLGTISACFGGVIRDMLCNDIPALFRKEIYATACIIGGSLFWYFAKFENLGATTYILPILATITIRLLAIKFNWQLPKM